jgi:hypothetical protein
VGCVDELKAAGRGEDAALLNVLSPALALQDSCDYRCGGAACLLGPAGVLGGSVVGLDEPDATSEQQQNLSAACLAESAGQTLAGWEA